MPSWRPACHCRSDSPGDDPGDDPVTFVVAAGSRALRRASADGADGSRPPRAADRAPALPGVCDPGAALEGSAALISRQVFDTLVAWREGSTDIEPALARAGLLEGRARVVVHAAGRRQIFTNGSPLTSLDVAVQLRAPAASGIPRRRRAWFGLAARVPASSRKSARTNIRTGRVRFSCSPTRLAHGAGPPRPCRRQVLHSRRRTGRFGAPGLRVVERVGRPLGVEARPDTGGSRRKPNVVFLD